MNAIPTHVAIIMDGNGRWGLKHKGDRIYGHKIGIENINKIINFCIKKKIKIVTLYSFSLDNWKRNRKEVKNIFFLFKNFYKKKYNKLLNQKIKINIIGENKFLPKKIILIKKKINNSKIDFFILKVNVAFNYSSKLEMLSAFKKTKIINLNNFIKNLYTYPDPDPDLIIRTGNRNRLSDFLLWQSAYSELFFSKKLWPDFTAADFNLILKKYINTKRNFGR